MTQYYNELIGYFVRFLGNKDAASDLVHDAYTRTLEAAQKGPIQNPRAFLYRTGKNLLIDRNRIKRHPHIPLEEAKLAPDETGTATLAYEATLEAIRTMPQRRREAFLLHRIEGLSHKEIAQQLGITTHMVEKHIMRAMVACREAISKAKGEGDE